MPKEKHKVFVEVITTADNLLFFRYIIMKIQKSLCYF